MDINYFFIFLLTNKILESFTAVKIRNNFLNNRLELVNPNMKANLLDKLANRSVKENLNKMRREIVEISHASRQYCGEALIYTLEFYCNQLKVNGTITNYHYESKYKNKRAIKLDDLTDGNQSGKITKNIFSFEFNE